jgi:hypothetical protein
MHLKHAADLLVNIISSLPCKVLIQHAILLPSDSSDMSDYHIHHILGSDYAESAQHNMGDVTITYRYISKICIKYKHIIVVTLKKYFTTNWFVIVFIYSGYFILTVQYMLKSI